MTKECYLELVRKLALLINNKIDELEELKALGTKTTQENDGMPHASGASDKVGNAATKIVLKEQEINHDIDVFVDLKDQIIGQIQKLSVDEYDVLYKYYVKDMGIFDIADSRGQSDRWVRKLKEYGIHNIEILQSDAYKKACKILF